MPLPKYPFSHTCCAFDKTIQRFTFTSTNSFDFYTLHPNNTYSDIDICAHANNRVNREAGKISVDPDKLWVIMV